MFNIQIVSHITKELFRVVVFVKEKDVNVDADISLVAKLANGKETVFLAAPKSEKMNFAYPENSSKFLHRFENGIYVAQSTNKALLKTKEIVVRTRANNKFKEKSIII